MRFPLILGADPKRLREGPLIPLGAGEWDIRMEQHVDSEVHICCANRMDLLPTLLDGSPVKVQGPMVVYIQISKPGTEKFLNVFAEQK